MSHPSAESARTRAGSGAAAATDSAEVAAQGQGKDDVQDVPADVAVATAGGPTSAAAAEAAAAAAPPDTSLWSREAVSVDQLAVYIEACMSEDPEQQFNGTRQVRRLLALEDDPPVEEVLASGLLPRFRALLAKHQHPRLQFEVAWALTNIACTKHTSVVVDIGVVPLLVQLVRCPNSHVREQSLWCLGNIAGDSIKYRDMVLGLRGALPYLLLNITHAANVSMTRTAVWTLGNLCRGAPQPALALVQQALPALAQLLSHTDAEVLEDACWCLAHIVKGSPARIHAVIAAGCVPPLVGLLTHPEPRVPPPALACIGHLMSGDEPQTQVVIDAGVLPVLVPLMSSGIPFVRTRAYWAMSQLAAATTLQVEALLSTPGFIKALFGTNVHESGGTVRQQVAGAPSVSSASDKSPAETDRLRQQLEAPTGKDGRRRLPGATRRQVGMRVACLLARPVTWAAATFTQGTAAMEVALRANSSPPRVRAILQQVFAKAMKEHLASH